jgi:hypothetical protein
MRGDFARGHLGGFQQQGIIRTVRGKPWYTSSVANLLARAKVLAEASR